MALSEYKRKRDFKKTPEPPGGPVAPGKAGALSFVVQKHAARRLHYDFRLELDGVLKSWAVPRGPSLDPGEKRLAVHVEDHPLEYGGFEGVIPQGQYGGGTVLLWDRGHWTPLDPDPSRAYEKGTLKFELDGEKLHGRWALVRMGGRKAAAERADNWLLIKERDAEALPGSGEAIVEENPLSVESGRAMAQIAADRDRVWESNHAEPEPEPAAPKRRTKPPPVRVAGARKAPLPDKLEAQLAKLAEAPPDGPEWLHEIKYDGYRLLARIARGQVRLLTRNGLDWTAKFPVLAERMAALPVTTAVIDGEVVDLDADGTTSFAGLQDKIASGRTEALFFYAFDLLHLDGWDLTPAALEDRKATLARIIPADSAGMLRYSDHQAGNGPGFFAQACRFELEGVVSKRRDKPYRPGRNDNWLKVKCANREEFVVIGFTDPAGQRHGIGALLLGYYDRAGVLHYAGRVGTGFADDQLKRLRERLDRIELAKCPVAALPKGVPLKGVHWTAPKLVAEVRFGNWTADAILRHASFEGLREDKSATEVVREVPGTGGRAGKAAKAAGAVEQRARDGSMTVEGVRLTHPDKVLYPDQGITKLDLAHYYAAIADWALPHLADRPLSLVRCPEGQGKTCFFQKHVGSGVPDQLGRVEIAEKSGSETYLVVRDLSGLMALVQIGVLEIHPWGSTTKKLETPDRVTFDLDPDVALPWERVAEAALEIREVLTRLGLQSFAKTTGGKGLHVVVPLTPRLDWDEVKGFTRAVAMRLAEEAPERYLAVASKASRRGRIYIDYLRNSRGATAIGAYSARARPGAPVSTPLFWEEVERAVRPETFTVATVPARLEGLKSDPWAGIGKLRQSISTAVRRRFGL
jgi:bifunctional non-homologous end joining protein LigD